MSREAGGRPLPEPPALDWRSLRTRRLEGRPSKVAADAFARPLRPDGTLAEFLGGLPRILAGESLRRVAAALIAARDARRPIVWGLGGHVIKVGVGPLLAQLAEHGFVDLLALNGAAVIHDFEVAIGGHTSEDVEAALRDGSFGMTEESGVLLNEVISSGVARGLGLGEAVVAAFGDRRFACAERSLLGAAARLGLPVTVHVALGTDTIHFHAGSDWELLGRGARRDFDRFAGWVACLGASPDAAPATRGVGGVFLNVGSAVLLPEIFLKAVTVARNLGHDLAGMVTVSMDFGAPYRPLENVVRRPPAALGGAGYHLCGPHEINVPLLAAMLLTNLPGEG